MNEHQNAPGEAPAGEPADVAEAGEPRRAGRLARSTAFFSLATAFSRVAGLVREIVAASYFGVTAQMSAFTIAFQVPNLVRSLFADAALQAAFVPVFTQQLEEGHRREAFRLASSMLFLVTLILGALTALFILLAPVVMPLFVPYDYVDVADLTVTLSRLLFPIVLLLGITGMVVGILNSLRPLRRLRSRALLLERGDHRGPRGARASFPGGGRDLRVRDRRPRRAR